MAAQQLQCTARTHKPTLEMTWALCSNHWSREGEADAAGSTGEREMEKTEGIKWEGRGCWEKAIKIITERKENSGRQRSLVRWINRVRACSSSPTATSSTDLTKPPPSSNFLVWITLPVIQWRGPSYQPCKSWWGASAGEMYFSLWWQLLDAAVWKWLLKSSSMECFLPFLLPSLFP